LARLRQRAEGGRQFREESTWLADNSRTFSGRWIALEGRQLLAVGATSKEVFSKVANRAKPPLVIHVADEDLPFAGW
jgi:hypothetical protein